MNSFGIGSKEVSFKWSMFMWIDIQDIQEKKKGIISLQASSTGNLLSPCKVLDVVQFLSCVLL